MRMAGSFLFFCKNEMTLPLISSKSVPESIIIFLGLNLIPSPSAKPRQRSIETGLVMKWLTHRKLFAFDSFSRAFARLQPCEVFGLAYVHERAKAFGLLLRAGVDRYHGNARFDGVRYWPFENVKVGDRRDDRIGLFGCHLIDDRSHVR